MIEETTFSNGAIIDKNLTILMSIFVLMFGLASVFYSCKSKMSTITVEVTKMDGTVVIQNVKARKSICIASYDDSVCRLIDDKENILIDSVLDYKVLNLKK